MSDTDIDPQTVDMAIELVSRTSIPTAPFVLLEEFDRRSDIVFDGSAKELLFVLVTDGYLEWIESGLTVGPTADDDVESDEATPTSEPDYVAFTDIDDDTVYFATESLIIAEDGGTNHDYRAHADDYDEERSDTEPNQKADRRRYDWFFVATESEADHEKYLIDDS